MSTVDLEDEAIIEQDYYGDDDDDMPDLPPMVAPLSPLANESAGNQPGALDGLLGAPEEDGQQKPHRIIQRKPQPKLDEELLTGPRGLPSIKKHFERVKFKGKGQEIHDLNLLMSEMEHWLNRLYPKLTMREMITKMDKLGKKKKVKTCISKIRMDMPILPEDFVDGEDITDDVLRGEEDEMEEDVPRGEVEERVIPSQQTNQSFLTEEQKERIKEKKREALERKAAKESKENCNELSQESTLANREAKMMAEINEMESELSGIAKSNTALSSLTTEEMDEIEKEMMGC